MPMTDDVLQRVDDDSMKDLKRILVGRNTQPKFGNPIGVELSQRDIEAIPDLCLELSPHGFLRQNQNSVAAASLDQFSQDHADLDRLAKSDAIRQQKPGAGSATGPSPQP